MALSAMPWIPHPALVTRKPTRWITATALKPSGKHCMDVEEGADIVMVKPALSYLDIIREVKNAVTFR
jgi:porphobilinogen synthase